MQQHYFIGINIPPTIHTQVELFQEKYQLPKAYKVIPNMDDLHVTLLYLGAVSTQQLPSLKQLLTEIAEHHSPFSIGVDGLSYFGSTSGPRVVYLAIGDCASLTSLQRDINAAVTHHLSLPLSNRFVPHITIAKKRKDIKPIFIEKEACTSIEVPVQAFSLFAVHPHKLSKYEAIESFRLL